MRIIEMVADSQPKLILMAHGVHFLTWHGETWQLYADRQGFIPVPNMERT